MTDVPPGVDLAPDPLCGVRDGELAWVNAPWREVLGAPAPGTRLEGLAHPDDHAAAAALAGGDAAGEIVTLRLPGADGGWLAVDCTACLHADGLLVVAARASATGSAVRFAPVSTSSAVRAVLEADDLGTSLRAISTALDDFEPGAAAMYFTTRDDDLALAHVDEHTLESGQVLERTQCHALARGAVHVSHPADGGASCGHAHADHVTVCLPVRNATEEFGLLVVHLPRTGASSSEPADAILPRLENVSVALAEVSARSALSRRALTDPLTGLPNRPAFVQASTRAIAALAHAPGSVGVAMLDLDHFKQVNDTLGHQAGDEALMAAARRMQGVLRDGDVVARMGGDEFAVLLPHCDAVALAEVCERLRLAIDSAPDGEGHGVTASIGAVLVRDADVPWEQVYSRADAALYDAKEAGRDRVVVGDLGAGQAGAAPG